MEEVAFNLIKQSVIYLPKDVKEALSHAYLEETNEVGKIQLKAILDNITLAEKHGAPVCQDTGTVTFYIKASEHIEGLGKMEKTLTKAVQKATLEVPLRPNAVNPFTQKNSGSNTGKGIPIVHWTMSEDPGLELTVFPKGGGSENASALCMLNPTEGTKGLKRFVVDSIIKAGAQPCPPTIIGVAVGGSADAAMALAKKQLLRELGTKNSDQESAKLEKEIFEAANETGIGPMGLGGKTTVLGVHLDYALRHPASYPVAVAFNCWAARRATAKITPDGTVTYLTHKLEGMGT